MEYSYPIDVKWSQEEILQFFTFSNCVEDAFESSVKREKFINT